MQAFTNGNSNQETYQQKNISPQVASPQQTQPVQPIIKKQKVASNQSKPSGYVSTFLLWGKLISWFVICLSIVCLFQTSFGLIGPHTNLIDIFGYILPALTLILALVMRVMIWQIVKYESKVLLKLFQISALITMLFVSTLMTSQILVQYLSISVSTTYDPAWFQISTSIAGGVLLLMIVFSITSPITMDEEEYTPTPQVPAPQSDVVVKNYIIPNELSQSPIIKEPLKLDNEDIYDEHDKPKLYSQSTFDID